MYFPHSISELMCILWRIRFKVTPEFLLIKEKDYLELEMETVNLTYNQRLRLSILYDILERELPYFPWLKIHRNKQ